MARTISAGTQNLISSHSTGATAKKFNRGSPNISMAAATATEPSCVDCILDSEPLKLPMGVRATEQMTTSDAATEEYIRRAWPRAAVERIMMLVEWWL